MPAGTFDFAYEKWMKKQTDSSNGERKRRLSLATNHAEKMFIEKVWWPAFGHFAHLNAEYELRDFRDGWRFLDFAYLMAGYKICIEIDGYGSHWREVSRSQFADHLMRQNQLVIDGWCVLRFSYDDVKERPRTCQQTIQQLLGKLGALSTDRRQVELTLPERAILKLAQTLEEPLTPKLVTDRLGLHRTTVLRHLKSLVGKELLLPSREGAKRVCGYRVNGVLPLDGVV